MKAGRDLIIIFARDWGINCSLITLEEAKSLPAPTAWLCGWLIEETDDLLKLAHELFTDSGQLECRYTSTIPKETIMFRKVISKDDISVNMVKGNSP